MKVKWCYQCNKEKLLREFYGPTEHKNALCAACYDKATEPDFERWGFNLED